jgi:hypothetical protein
MLQNGQQNPEHPDPLSFLRGGDGIRSMLTPFVFFFHQGFGSLVVFNPLKQEPNGRKTKTHESDQTIITVT